MIISEKLYQLRMKSGLSQEDLAQQMNVSRQSISKWESGSSIPSIDKILELSNFYGVSTDFLLQDDLEEFPDEVVVQNTDEASLREVTLDQAHAYIEVVKVAATQIGIGVLLCIASPISVLLMDALYWGGKTTLPEEVAEGIGAAGLFVCVAIAVILFILNGIRLSQYKHLSEEVFRLEYGAQGILEKEENGFMKQFAKWIAMGVALCILSIVPMLIFEPFGEIIETYMACVMLGIVAVGVFMIVYVAIQKGAYSKLLQKGGYDQEKKKIENEMGEIATIYWCIVTAIYLGVSFLTSKWQVSWVIWPIAAMIYVAIVAALRIKQKNSH